MGDGGGDALPARLPPGRGQLGDRPVMEAMLASYEVGGHAGTAAPRDAGMADLLRACMDDVVATGLLARFLRGDRTVTTALIARMDAMLLPLTGLHPDPRLDGRAR